MNRYTSFRIFFVIALAALILSSLGVTPVDAQGGKGKERLKLSLKGGDKAADVIKQLRDLELAPKGGAVRVQVRQTVIQVRQEGDWYFPLGRGTELKDFVIHFEVRASAMDGDTNGCGMAFRARQNGDFSYVLLTKDRRIVVTQVEDKENIVDFDEDVDDLEGLDASDYSLDSAGYNIVTLVAIGETLSLFLNGIEIITLDEGKSVRGRFATMLFNEDGNNTLTECRYSNVWVWSFDK